MGSTYQGCNSQPTSIISLENYGNPRSLKFVGVKNSNLELKIEEKELKSFNRLLRSLNMTNLTVSAILFISVAVAAACLCTPVSILGGLLISLLFLSQGIIGHHVMKLSTRSLLIGYSCLSGFVSLMSLSSALYLFSGQYIVMCASRFHSNDHESGTRLYIVQVTTLLSTVPLLVGSISALITTVLCATETRKTKKRHEPQLFLYLQDSYGTTNPSDELPQVSSSEEGLRGSSGKSRPPDSPPPTYRKITESFA